MLITRTITKKLLETIVHQAFSNFGHVYSSALLDSLKLLGFYYATTAGISINTEDLKTPKFKKSFLNSAEIETQRISKLWGQGLVSDAERFQCIIDSWNVATESLKSHIIEYYENFDPVNNLYLMAFSGARGNMSQVRQLIGMRGLMSDQEGKIIDLPIQSNFREGLSSIDYMISSYGARKGIVDTALKTADSGYLTRRLIYVAQDIIIREIDCSSTQGLILFLNSRTNAKNILGRLLISVKQLKNNKYIEKYKNQIITVKTIKALKEMGGCVLNIRSPLTCCANGSTCQSCYGWDLAQEKIIALGDSIGVIAAQSIGEPGTQLTMRTFHTGGIFTSEMVHQIIAPFSGKIKIPSNLKTTPYRTRHGNRVLKLQQETTITITDWNNTCKNIFLERGSFLYIENSCFVKKGMLLAEQPTSSIIADVRQFKPVYASLSGQICFESVFVKYLNGEDKSKILVTQDDDILWIASGKLFSLPKEANFTAVKTVVPGKVLARLQIAMPHSGILNISNGNITVKNETQTLKLNILAVLKNITNCSISLSMIAKSYQYIDEFTTIAFINIYANETGTVYLARKKESCYINNYFLVLQSDILIVNLEQVQLRDTLKLGKAYRIETSLNMASKTSLAGVLIRKDGIKYIFQKAKPIFLTRGAILNYKKGDFVFEKELLATLVNHTQQTEDIVQGLPKIEELIEARSPKQKAELACRPSIVLKPRIQKLHKANLFTEGLFFYRYNRFVENDLLKRKHQVLSLIHSIPNINELVFYNEKLWKISPLPKEFFPFQLYGKKELCFINKQGSILLINIKGKKLNTGWLPKSLEDNASKLFYRNSINEDYKTLKFANEGCIFQNKKTNHFILKLKNKTLLFLEQVDPITKYDLPLTTKVSAKAGSFVDIGEPLTEGPIDQHELLLLLFNYHSVLDGILNGIVRCLNKFQLLLVHSILSIYQSQGVTISSKHVEIIVKQMTSKVLIKSSGDTPLLAGELIRLSLIVEICKALRRSTKISRYKTPKYEPLLLSATNSSLSKDGFLSSAGFQETKKILTKAAIEGNSDWLRGLKECVLVGRLIPAGSAFLNYKNYLDNIYLFKD
jgi:hypothetical protein